MRLRTKSRRVIRDNLVRLIREGHEEALSEASERPLPRFKRVHRSSAGVVSTEFPTCSCVAARSRFATGNGYLEAEHEFDFVMKLTGPDAEQLDTDADIYLEAIDSLIRNAPANYLLAGLETAQAFWEVTEHDNDSTRGGGTKYVQLPSFTVRFSVMEVSNG